MEFQAADAYSSLGRKKKVKVSYYMPWRHMGGEEVYLLFILNLGTRWG
jgi:hypothetical protein